MSDLGLTEARAAAFTVAVWEHYRRSGRDLPWRHTYDPYEILVSEVMLQQTQVARVLDRYGLFLREFPDLQALAASSVADVLAMWSGLGYNRRALALRQTANIVVAEHGGRIPASLEELRRLPGVGPVTAAAVCVFAFGQAHAFVETNIRAAFIHFFFQESVAVSDAELLPLVEMTLDREDPRRWYYALMDYGVWVKRVYTNPSRKSTHHTAQTPFAGSRRELRAQALRALLAIGPSAADAGTVQAMLPAGSHRAHQVASVLDELTAEGFLRKENGTYCVG